MTWGWSGPPTGSCASCGRVMSLISMTGMVRRHGMGEGKGHIDCPGSRQPPAKTPTEPTQRIHARRSE